MASSSNIFTVLIENLDVVSKIQDGHKLYINRDNIICLDEPYMFQGIWRYFNNISRKDAINVLTKLFNDIEIYANTLYIKKIDDQLVTFSEHDYNELTTIITKLNNSLAGIENLKKTYVTDENICKELDKLIEKIHSLVNDFNKMIVTTTVPQTNAKNKK